MKPLSPREWELEWERHRFGGASTRLVLQRLARKMGIPYDDLKERIVTPTDRQKDRDVLLKT